MFESENPNAYEKVYIGLVERLGAMDLAPAGASLGLERRGLEYVAPLLGREYLVGPQGVRAADGGGTPFTHRIVLAWYLIHGGSGEPAQSFVPYRELPGGADFARTLSQLVDNRLATGFGHKLAQLSQAALALGGEELPTTSASDGAWRFGALPKLPLELRFYDADEEFPAEAKILYDITAPNILDLECLAVMGQILVMELERAAGVAPPA
ncbi:MAG: DUF3786 domain-containing protein [Desulfarculaceae bacterium]|nr:DUF3786 domain-containing protein [Desulfarculaceae bacterium]MCF8072586.1 DUF3786 domain-containing protein [Desulfarculaceae bacterium]MCF8103342.1 DUF3786 domain-containing protein [Desulfarculaceae bacterium]MCF8117493.1 DUF3786 domain-containing protein [Desulfarculaceae bacterium]